MTYFAVSLIRAACIAALIVLMAAPAHAQANTTQPATQLAIQPLQGKHHQFGKLELVLQTDGVFANPFDPAQADVQVTFTSPNGQTASVPAFWFVPFDGGPAASGPGEWRARFTPTAAGAWTAQARLAGTAISSKPIRFTVEADSAARGFVRIDRANPRGFAFDNGTPYVPIGLNIGWAEGAQDQSALDQYTAWFDALSQNGGNIARVWMPAWGTGIEWDDTGLGDYTKRMDRAWLLDQIFRLAEERGIYVMLTLVNHGQFSETTNAEWQSNPYNAKNGGPLKTPGEFVTNTQAKELFKRRLRYIAARWGYSTSLFAWEWWNEINWTPIGDDTLKPWIQEMTPALLKHDPNHHLISTSYATGSGSTIWQMPEINFAQQHDYSGSDPMSMFRSVMRAFQDSAPDKPVLMAEHGYSASGADALDRELIHLHNGIWAAPFSGFAGSGMYWWWDKLIGPRNLWAEYKHLADFVAGETLAAYKPGKPQTPRTFDALALRQDSRQLVWVRSAGYEAGALQKAHEQAVRDKKAGPDWKYTPPLVSGQTFTVTGMVDGRYVARFYSPQTGQWLNTVNLVVKDGKGALPLPNFDHDLAIRIGKLE